jgi:hypothetical protein
MSQEALALDATTLILYQGAARLRSRQDFRDSTDHHESSSVCR